MTNIFLTAWARHIHAPHNGNSPYPEGLDQLNSRAWLFAVLFLFVLPFMICLRIGKSLLTLTCRWRFSCAENEWLLLDWQPNLAAGDLLLLFSAGSSAYIKEISSRHRGITAGIVSFSSLCLFSFLTPCHIIIVSDNISVDIRVAKWR